jgi:hypothetical protein
VDSAAGLSIEYPPREEAWVSIRLIEFPYDDVSARGARCVAGVRPRCALVTPARICLPLRRVFVTAVCTASSHRGVLIYSVFR